MAVARRNQCALPECEDVVFSTLGKGLEHARESHGFRGDHKRLEDALVLFDPPDPQLLGRKGGHSRDYAPTPEEFRRLVEAARNEMGRVIFLVLGESGLRANELLHLRPAWLRDGFLRVPYEDPESSFQAKTPQAERSIPLRQMSGEAWDALKDWCEGPQRRSDWGNQRPFGISSPALWRRVRRGGMRARLGRKLFPHALRAFCATTWAYRLGSPFTLMNLMGWASLDVAMAYVRRSGRPLEKAVERWNLNGGRIRGSSSRAPRLA